MSKWEPTTDELNQVYSYVEWLEDENERLKSEKCQLKIKYNDSRVINRNLKNEAELYKSMYKSIKETIKNSSKRDIVRANESELYYRELAKKFLDERNELKKRLKEVTNGRNR